MAISSFIFGGRYRNIGRIRHIVLVFLGYGFGHLIARMGLRRLVPFGRRWEAKAFPPIHEIENAPVRLRRAFEELQQGTFLKTPAR